MTWDVNEKTIHSLHSKDNYFGLIIYENICASVSDYLDNLNTPPSYKQLRKTRKIENILGHIVKIIMKHWKKPKKRKYITILKSEIIKKNKMYYEQEQGGGTENEKKKSKQKHK